MCTLPNVAGTLLALMGAGLSAVLAPASSHAQQQKAQVACYVPGSGTVYRIKQPNTPAQCRPGHTEFTISDAAEARALGVASAAGGNAAGEPSGPAGGDLGGTYPAPSVVKLQGQPVSPMAPTAGHVLTFNGTNWAPRVPAVATLPTLLGGMFDFSNENGLISIGKVGTGLIPNEVWGPGTRFLWLPVRRAIRAGGVDGGQWDPGSIGVSSAAFGYNTVASGSHSFAAGGGADATGHGAVAIGNGPEAHGFAATALGHLTLSTAFGSTAIGLSTKATGTGSFASGSMTTASGKLSLATGAATTASGESSTAMGRLANTNGMTGAFVYGDASTSTDVSALADNQFVVRAQRFWLGKNNSVTATAGRFLETSTGAYLSAGGTWTNSSDVNRKHDFQSVDGEQLLERIAAMPVSTWSYRDEGGTTRHMGPTAQDFRAAFSLGDTDKAIATVDADGVSLAGIKALVRRTSELRRENDELRAALAEVDRRLAKLERGGR